MRTKWRLIKLKINQKRYKDTSGIRNRDITTNILKVYITFSSNAENFGRKDTVLDKNIPNQAKLEKIQRIL